jgi:hypothetical protein
MAEIKSVFSNMFHTRAFTTLSHILGLLLFFSLPVIFLGQQLHAPALAGMLTTRQYWVFFGCYIVLFYVNAYWFIPRLLLRKKYLAYSGILVLLFLGVFLLQPFDQLVAYVSRRPGGPAAAMGSRPALPAGGGQAAIRHRPPLRENAPVDIVSLFLFVMIVALNLAVESSRQWRSSQKRALQAEADKANAELSFLKAQVNPHFLFNTLNNIYSLVVTHNENAGPALLKLSNIMRYVTDEVHADFVPLQHEVDCIRDYIALQSLRLGKMVTLDFNISGLTDDRFIAPLVLIPFIENVFKYGISNHAPAPLRIHLKVLDDSIVFFCQNKIFPNKSNLERAGIGIANTRERLRHSYPDKHRLDITTDEGLFTVRLTLQA